MKKQIETALYKLIGGPYWSINKELVRKIGLYETLFITDLSDKRCYFASKGELDEEGYFYNVQSQIKDDTGIGQDHQTSIIKRLTDLGTLNVKKKGLPAKNYYKIDMEKVSEILGSNDPVETGTSTGFEQALVPGLNRNIYNKNKGNKNKDNNSPSKEGEKAPVGPSSLSLGNPSQQTPIGKESPKLRRRRDALPPRPQPRVSYSARKVLEAWNGSGLRRHQDPNTKVHKEVVSSVNSLIRGTYFDNRDVFNGYKGRKFSVDDIVQSVRLFALAALNPDYEPIGGYKQVLAKISLPDFLYNPFAQDDNKSQFLRYLERPPALARDALPLPKDEHPEYTQKIKGLYAQGVKGGISGTNGKQDGKFIRAGKRIHDFYRENGKRLDPLFTRTVDDRVRMVFDAVMEFYKERGVQPGNFCSDYTFDHILPIYLERQAVLR